MIPISSEGHGGGFALALLLCMSTFELAEDEKEEGNNSIRDDVVCKRNETHYD